MDKSTERRLLQTMVPVNALTQDHLETLLRDHDTETVIAGAPIFSRGDYDNRHVYLISGSVRLADASGNISDIHADDELSRFPVAHQQPRQHDATALSDCTIIRFNSDRFDGMLAWDQAAHYILLDVAANREFDEDADWMMTLLQSNLFYKVPPMNIRKIIDKFEPVYFSAGERVIRQGEVGDCCYLIKEGLVGVYVAEDERGQSVQVNELGVGRVFGEDALVNDASRNATIIMHTNGVLMRLSKRDFFVLLRHPEVKSLVLQDVATAFDGEPQWIDVRTQDEFECGHYRGALNMPLDLLKLKSRMLSTTQPYIVYCNSGRRCEAAAYLLSEDGFNAVMLRGGIDGCAPQERSLFQARELMVGSGQ